MLYTLLQFCCGTFFTILKISNGSFPQPLSPQEEADCLKRYFDGDENARNCLIEHNLRLVAHIVKKYTPSGSLHDADDLISIGTIGLIKAINSFKPEKGTKLATYTARCIENAILSPMIFRHGILE